MKKIIITLSMFFSFTLVWANNIQISNISVIPANNTIKFDLSWENSWRSNTLNNWDAAWVFFKYKHVNGDWVHIFLTNSGNIIPAGYAASFGTTNTENMGVFLYRSVAGFGNNTLTDVELGIPAEQASGIHDIKAFALEMVYVPGGAFYVGDGVSTNSYFYLSQPGYVNSSNGVLYVNEPFGGGLGLGVLQVNYPRGFNAFYCMKYELSQGGYRDFLNTLTYSQQIAHIIPAPNAVPGTYALATSNRNNIKIKSSGTSTTVPAVFGCDANNNGIFDEVADGEYVACNYLNWVDHAAYLDWAGLRPLTELEYEKAARGIQLPVAGEYAWGNNQVGTSIYILVNQNQPDELVTSPATAPVGNANYLITFPNSPYNGPMRNGIFATATSNRINSGGSFYGIMELSGNLWERVVTTANTAGKAFNGAHGYGNLGSLGHAVFPANTWPGGGGPGAFWYANLYRWNHQCNRPHL